MLRHMRPVSRTGHGPARLFGETGCPP
jgi:hypothetical protein